PKSKSQKALRRRRSSRTSSKKDPSEDGSSKIDFVERTSFSPRRSKAWPRRSVLKNCTQRHWMQCGPTQGKQSTSVTTKTNTMKTRRYSELVKLETFEERFEYLRLPGQVGQATFGFDRYINQQFYRSRQWKDVPSFVIFRDNGCDLGIKGHDIGILPLIHHVNPLTAADIT